VRGTCCLSRFNVSDLACSGSSTPPARRPWIISRRATILSIPTSSPTWSRSSREHALSLNDSRVGRSALRAPQRKQRTVIGGRALAAVRTFAAVVRPCHHPIAAARSSRAKKRPECSPPSPAAPSIAQISAARQYLVLGAASTVAIVAIAAAIIVVGLLVFDVLPRGGRRKRPPRT